MTPRVGPFEEILLLEDDAKGTVRDRRSGATQLDARVPVSVRVHRINGTGTTTVAETTYRLGAKDSNPCSRVAAAVQLLDEAVDGTRETVVVAGISYGGTDAGLAMLCEIGLPFVVQTRPSKRVRPAKRPLAPMRARDLLADRGWTAVKATMPDGTTVKFGAMKLGSIALSSGPGKLFAAHPGGVEGIGERTLIGISSFDCRVADLVQLIAIRRWLRPALRREKRRTQHNSGARPAGAASELTVRANITLARRQDERAVATAAVEARPHAKRSLLRAAPSLNVVELFSGAGGMGLGFLLGGGADRAFRIIWSAEADPVCVETLRTNHRRYDRTIPRGSTAGTPEEHAPIDLRKRKALENAVDVATGAGDVHIVIGGPPCQGFSAANRNSWVRGNAHNELVRVFIRYVKKLQPLAFLMENVQGILWTRDAKRDLSVVDVIEQQLKRAGYVLFPKLLDAAWYGVPQHRTRYFLMGLHRDLGYRAEDFGRQGPFPQASHGPGRQPMVTVEDAIGDLPPIGNGYVAERSAYVDPSNETLERNAFLRYVRDGAEERVVLDHVTSRHADYVIERYRRIPEGGNWESICESLTNYADASRTHSNIYRRLSRNQPAITIGHYRKSMLVHPSQDRGLSLREASRLQSLPDWFRFAGKPDGSPGGLVFKQQQLANAVSPLVTKAIAEFMLSL